jgi:chromosome segregation ATPase
MADENILAGMTPEQADADITAREGKVEQLEATLKTAKDNLRAAQRERKQLKDDIQELSDLYDQVKKQAEAGPAEGHGGAS